MCRVGGGFGLLYGLRMVHSDFLRCGILPKLSSCAVWLDGSGLMFRSRRMPLGVGWSFLGRGVWKAGIRGIDRGFEDQSVLICLPSVGNFFTIIKVDS